MTADAIISGELKSLNDELSASQQKRLSMPAERTSESGDTAAPVDQPEGTVEEQQEGQLHDLVEAITGFVKDAEKNMAAHPAANAIGALVVGILIGRLLSRR
jgi:ElaB/YqjD/DUF883 family membrane-anchored ribosome-binding protein